jgi:tetratricopeptide (TPR) repeat protein
MTWSRTGSILAMFVIVFLCRPAAAVRQSSDLSVNFQAVQALLQQGRLEEAKARMIEELQQNPSSVAGYNLLGIIESEEQDYQSAVAAFQKALALDPSSLKTHNNLGNVYLTQKKLDQAEKEFRIVLRRDPNDRDANYNLGMLQMAKGSSAEAIVYFVRVHPQNAETRFNLIRAYLQSNHPAAALRMTTELSAEEKNDARLHFSLGVLLASHGQYKPAELELEKADALQPATFEILYSLGQVYLRSGEFPNAELPLTQALKLKPDSPDTLYLLAQVYTNESRPLDALDLLVRARKIAPENTDILFLMAQISISQKYFEDAIPLLEKGLQIAPQRSDLREALGESYFMSGNLDKAIAQLKNSTEIKPSARTNAFLGLSYEHLGRFDEAKQAFRNALKLDPHNSFCLFYLGYIAERQGDLNDAEVIFQNVLRSDPHFADALLELANLRIEEKKLPESAELLRKYVGVVSNPATGYYKLAMVERSLHEIPAADRDLARFQALSKDASVSSYPYEHLFDYLDSRSKLAPSARNQQDMAELVDQVKKNPDQPEALFLLAEAYLKSGNVDEAKSTIAHLDTASKDDSRTLAGTGVLLARYHLYDDAIQHFQAALRVNPNSDEISFDLANAYFRKGLYSEALSSALQVSAEGRKDESYLALLGDIYAHLGDTVHAEDIYRSAINRNPDNDQDYLSLALLQFRENQVEEAKQTLIKGQARIPSSGKLVWGLGIVSVLEGNTAEAGKQFEHAVDLLPEWPGSYSTLGVFYFQTGQVAKAKEVLDRFKNSDAKGGLDVNRIEQILAQTPATSPNGDQPMTISERKQLLQLSLYLADKTL